MSREDQQFDPVKAYLSALGRRGGKSRMSKLSQEERAQLGRKGAAARYRREAEREKSRREERGLISRS